MKVSFIFIVFLLITLASCKNKHVTDDTLVAKVGDKYLTIDDLRANFPSYVKPEDSSAFVAEYINKWVRQNLMLQKAELNIGDEEMDDIDKQIDEYKTSLLLFKYEQKLIEQKFDTTITKREIEEYYNNHTNEFKLDNTILKCTFIKLKKDNPNLTKIRNLYWSEKDEHQQELEELCQLNADTFIFDDTWITSDFLEKILPISFPNHDNYLKYNKFIEAQDSLFKYFVNVKTYLLKDDPAPMAFIEKNIRVLLQNKKKIDLIREVENNLYETALQSNGFEIYNKK